MEASFNGEGTSPEEREELIIFVMSGERVVRQALMWFVGRGSREQVEDFMPATADSRSDGVMFVNEEKLWVGGVGVSCSGPGGGVASWLWIFFILSWKKVRKLLHFSAVKVCEMVSMGLRSLFIVENSALGLPLPD